jgi:hypothetical protein
MGETIQLKELRQDSGRRLPTSVIVGFTQNASAVLPVQITGGNSARRTSPADTRVLAQQRLKLLQEDSDKSFTGLLNDALLGASDYPVLNAVLGTAVGIGTGGASLIFTVATTALSAAKTSSRVLARDGDEIWRVEEIGIYRSQPTYLLAYFLVDPNRSKSMNHKGWLLHEARYALQT